MVFHLVLGLVGPPPLPINVVNDLQTARQPALPYLPTAEQLKATPNPKPSLRLFLIKSVLRILRYHRYRLAGFSALQYFLHRANYVSLKVVALSYVLAAYYVYKRQVALTRQWSNNFTSNQYQSYPQLKDEPTYKDQKLIDKAFQLPVARHYKSPITYQPISGYCGYATFNCVITSIAQQLHNDALHAGLLQFHAPNYVAVDVMCTLLEKLRNKGLWQSFGITGYEDLSGVSYQGYMKIVKEQINDPRYRWIACWHRSPLFFCDGDMQKRMTTQTMVHWSPVAGYLAEEDKLLIIDVNEAYGPFLVSPERFFATLDIRDYASGKYMGLVRIDVAAKSSSAPSSGTRYHVR